MLGDNLIEIFRMPMGIQTRWASPENFNGDKGVAGQAKNGRKGSPYFPLKSKQSQILAEETGTSGTVRRIWITITNQTLTMLRGLRIDMYWDGADRPAVSAPLGDFFGQGLGRMIKFESALFSNPEGCSFNCCIPMPFKTGMKIEVTNEMDNNLGQFYYDVDYTIGDPHGDEMGYFHAHWRREKSTRKGVDYEFLPLVTGKGRFLGVNAGIIVNTNQSVKSFWWGEGEVKIYLDGDLQYPTLCGTGTEDYIGTAWMLGNPYAHLYQGCHWIDAQKSQYCFYRYHIPDPVYFYQDIRVAIQQIGMSYAGLFDRAGDDWSSCAYFYLNQPVTDLPLLAPVDQRIEELIVVPVPPPPLLQPFQVEAGGPYTVLMGDELTVRAIVSGNMEIKSIRWDFGDLPVEQVEDADTLRPHFINVGHGEKGPERVGYPLTVTVIDKSGNTVTATTEVLIRDAVQYFPLPTMP